MGFRSLTWLGCVLLIGCGRTGLDVLPVGSSAGGGASQHVDDPSDEPSDDPSDDPVPVEPHFLPEISVAAAVDSGDLSPGDTSESLVLVAPLEAERGPFELTRSHVFDYAFSPHGKRFAFIESGGAFAVDSWPPVATFLRASGQPREMAWVDDARLVVNDDHWLLLYELELGTRETLHEATQPGSMFRLISPSPDGRWLAFVESTSDVQQAWLMKLDDPSRPLKLIYETLPGSRVAWFDWAPDSEHLAFNVSDTTKVLLTPYSVSTKNGAVGYVAPISFTLGENEQVPLFDWSPDGKAIEYWFDGVDATNASVNELYLVDMAGAVGGSSVLLSSFAEPHWANHGSWSPRGDMIAFQADIVGSTFHPAQFVVRTQGPSAPIQAHAEEFEQVLQQTWSPDGKALYFLGSHADYVEHVYKSDLRGHAVQLTSDAVDVRGIFVSSEPGCIAHGQVLPKPGLTIVKESTASSFDVAQPKWNSPNWTPDFESSYTAWVNDSSGLRGLLYRTSSATLGDTLAWVSVEDCVPQEPQALIEGHEHQVIRWPAVSTSAPSHSTK